MKATRRGFLGALATLPFIGKALAQPVPQKGKAEALSLSARFIKHYEDPPDARLMHEAAEAFHAALRSHDHRTRLVKRIRGARQEFYVTLLAPTSIEGWRACVVPAMGDLADRVVRAGLTRLTTLDPPVGGARYSTASSRRLGIALTGVRQYSITTDQVTFTIYVKGRA